MYMRVRRDRKYIHIIAFCYARTEAHAAMLAHPCFMLRRGTICSSIGRSSASRGS